MTCDRKAKILAFLGCLATGVAILTLGFGSTLAINFIEAQIPLDNPNRKVFKIWQDTAHDGTTLYRRFYFYQVNNAERVVTHHEVPDVSVVGPYVFRERQWNPEEEIYWTPEGTLAYRYHDILDFDAELSVDENRNQLTVDDKVTVINAAFYALTHRLSQFPNASFRTEACLLVDVLQLGNPAVGDTGIFMRRSVREILFGYDEPLFTALVDAMKALNVIKEILLEPPMEYNMPTRFQFVWNGTLPAPSPWSGASGQRCPVWDDQTVCNRSAYATSQVWAGVDWGREAPAVPGRPPNTAPVMHGLPNVGSLSSWAGQDRMWWWGAPEAHGGDCQVFEGGTGMTYPPRMDADGTPYVYVDSIYRKMRLDYKGDTTVKGIPAKQYRIDRSEIDFSENSKCYFQEYVGVFNMTPVVFAPLSVTGILFLDVAPWQPLKEPTFHVPGWERLALNVTINGQNASEYGEARRPDWETYLNVFNDAGMLLDGAARLQSNTWLKSVVIDGCPGSFSATLPKNFTDANGNTYLSYLPETLLPIFFVSREALVSDSLAEYIRDDVLVVFTVMHALGGLFTALSVILFIATGYQWSRLSPKGAVAVAVSNGFEGHASEFFVQRQRPSDALYAASHPIN